MLDSNQIEGPIQLELENLKSLRRLQLNSNQIEGPIPLLIIGNLSQLALLSLSYNSLNENLTYLKLASNNRRVAKFKTIT
ncbi:hypothetical protein HN51_041367, partial [Arachis hypogaea]